jgi:hypothetical protein
MIRIASSLVLTVSVKNSIATIAAKKETNMPTMSSGTRRYFTSAVHILSHVPSWIPEERAP